MINMKNIMSMAQEITTPHTDMKPSPPLNTPRLNSSMTSGLNPSPTHP